MSVKANYVYVGSELDVFAKALNWKRYYGKHLSRFIKGDVLEVGAGIGGTTQVLCNGAQNSWVCLEPDAALANFIRDRTGRGEFAREVEVVVGDVRELPAGRTFDSILYIDVLEHLADDRGELQRASGHLKAGGSLVVLAPAHNVLYSEFDRAVGHFRRYNETMLRSISPATLELERVFYLDACGMLLSLANRMILRSGTPTDGQIQLWDRFIIPISKFLDPFTIWRIGKTIVGIWSRTA